MTNHLTAVARTVLNATDRVVEAAATHLTGPTGIQVTADEVREVGKMSNTTATGLDDIPANILKHLGVLEMNILQESSTPS